LGAKHYKVLFVYLFVFITKRLYIGIGLGIRSGFILISHPSNITHNFRNPTVKRTPNSCKNLLKQKEKHLKKKKNGKILPQQIKRKKKNRKWLVMEILEFSPLSIYFLIKIFNNKCNNNNYNNNNNNYYYSVDIN
jgi:hypothetical protein